VALLDAEIEAMPVPLERREEFADLFEEYGPAVSYFFARRGFPPEDCRDLMQETFLKAYRGLAGFRDDAGLRTWLLKIAANVWKNALRSRQTVKRSAMKTVSLEGALTEDEVPEGRGEELRQPGSADPLDRVLRDESRRMLREAVAELPPRMRRCVQLRIDRSLKYREIAAILQVSVDTVKTQLHQARQRLKGDLDAYFALGDDGE
jgi:RNA polymerase sigma-70 factor (ECF subfamily)